MTIMMVTMFSYAFVSCSSDDDENNGAIAEYLGTWSCNRPATNYKSTIVKKGTVLLITSFGDMTWTLPNGSKYNASMHALGDDWADITYNGKTYRAEIYVSSNTLSINVNGDANLKTKDFPFDGDYEKVK